MATGMGKQAKYQMPSGSKKKVQGGAISDKGLVGRHDKHGGTKSSVK